MAAITAAFLLNAFISAASALGLIALNIEGTTAAGAFAYTLSFGAQGFLFAAVTLLAAQLFSTARASSGAAFAVMGVSFMLRAYGDIRNNILSYISPMGLGLKVEAFYTDNFVPVIVLFAEAVAISAVALAINLKRDVGSGVFPARKGREHASYFLKSPFGFALRLLRNSILSWSMVFIAVGAMFGSVISQLDSFLESNELMRQLLTIQSGAVSTAEAFLPMLCGMTAMIISIPVITAISRLYGEEKRGRMEQIYARAVPRTALFLSFAAIALAQAVKFTLCSVFGIYAAAQGTGLLQLSTLMKASFVYLQPSWRPQRASLSAHSRNLPPGVALPVYYLSYFISASVWTYRNG
jgi:ABC-2 type transport system permease protein